MSEAKLQRELNQAWIVHSRRNFPKVRRLKILAGLEELWMVKQVEKLSPEIQLHTFPEWQWEVFDSRKICVHKARTIESRAGGCSQFAWWGVNETFRIKPFSQPRVAELARTNLDRPVQTAREVYPGVVTAGDYEKRESRGDFFDHIDSPTSQNSVYRAAPRGAEPTTPAKREVIYRASSEIMIELNLRQTPVRFRGHTSRLCDVEKRTVLNLLKTAGDCCERFMERTLRNVPIRDLQLDECWSYVLKKEGHKLPHETSDTSIGDQYVFIALERNSKLIVTWHLGKRDRENTSLFISKVRSATTDKRFEISTDAWTPYMPEIDRQLSDRANHSIVVKVYDKPEETRERYSPGNFVTVEKSVGSGNPDLG
jgi:hypothetical protein